MVWGRGGNTTGSSACTTVAMKHPGAVSEFEAALLDLSHRTQKASVATCQGACRGDQLVLGCMDHSGKALLVHVCLMVLKPPALLVSLSGETTFVGFSFFQ